MAGDRIAIINEIERLERRREQLVYQLNVELDPHHPNQVFRQDLIFGPGPLERERDEIKQEIERIDRRLELLHEVLPW